MPKKVTELQKRQAKRMYEEDGETQSAIARHFGVTPPTVMNWRKQGEWVKLGSSVPEPEVESESVGMPASEPVFPDPPPPPPAAAAPNTEAALRARIAELEEENKALKPTYDLGSMFTDRVKWLTDHSPEGEQYWLNRAEAEFKSENRQRAKDGLPIFSVKEHPDILDDIINGIKTKEIAAASKPVTSPPSRKIKMFIMRNGMPTIEQLPLESQVNNMAGSLADGIVRYTRKGFKLTDPFLCPRAGCFKPAGLDEFQRWAFDGYCTVQHRLEVEGDDPSPTTGLQTKDTILSGIN